MASNSGQVNIGAGTFPPGTKVKLHDRLGDGKGVNTKSAEIGKDGTVSFSGLKPGAQYWLEGENLHGRDVTVAVTAKEPAQAPQAPRDPEAAREDLKQQALDQGSTLAPPIEGMKSSATQAPRPTDQQQRNRETMESAQRTAKALASADLVGAQVDRNAAAHAGLVTAVDAGGTASIVATSKQASKPTSSTASSGKSSDAAARKRSAAAKKAAATRKRNAARRKSSSSSGSKS